MPPLLRHFASPPILPPVPELSFDILDGLSFEFDTVTTPPSPNDPTLPLHSPLPVKLMPSRLIPPPPPSSLADVPENLSDIEESNENRIDDQGRALSITLPYYFQQSPSLKRTASVLSSDTPLRSTAPLNIRKKMSTSPPVGLDPLRLLHRITLPDCPRSPTPEYRSVEPLHPVLASIVNGDLREGDLPDEIANEPGITAFVDQPPDNASTTSYIPQDDPFPNTPFQLPPGIECTCGNCESEIPPSLTQRPLPPVPETPKSIPSPRPSPRTGRSGHASPAGPPPAVRSPYLSLAVHECGHDHRGPTDHDQPPVSLKNEWDSQSARSRDTLDPPAALYTHMTRGTPSPQPSIASSGPPTRPPRPPRPPRPEGLGIATLGPLEHAPPAHLVHLQCLERPFPHYEKAYPASTKGSTHSRRPSELENAPLGALREAFAEGTKAFVTTLKKPRDEERRRSVYSHRRGAASDTWAPSEFDIPPPTTNAKAVSLLGHHDRRHDRRGSDADELQLQLAPRPFPGATSKAAALLGIGVAEPPPVRRFAKFSSPKATMNALHTIRRTQPTGWSGAGVGATMRRMSQYTLDMMEDDIDVDDDLEPPAPVASTPHQEEATITPGPGQSFTPVSTRLSVHGASPRAHGTHLDDHTPSPGGSGHPFAAVPATPQTRIRPESTSPSRLSVYSGSTSHLQYSPASVYSLPSTSSSSPSPGSSRAPTALQRKRTIKARPPPISVERVSPTRVLPVAEVPTPSTAMQPATPLTARPWTNGDDDPPRLKSHILAKYRLIEPPIAATESRNSTCTAMTEASGITRTESSGSLSGDTYTSRESYATSARESYAASARESYAASTREGYVPSHRSLRTATSTESFGSIASVLPSVHSRHSLARVDTTSLSMSMSATSLSRLDTMPIREDRSLTARLNRHVRNASTASSTTSAFSAVNSATATLRAAANATLSWGFGSRIAPGLTVPEHGMRPPEPREAQPPPWHNYNIRYDKDGREIPDLTPRPPAGPPVEESWFEPSTPISPVDGEVTKLHKVGTLVRHGWKRK
ncbi:uncharacterized protein CcaverHIS019_0608390 [Cutaneotrichosporon cavernicola]|uniref:Uncharacterized protein n=1 Tax=Cutaneotrichosporon cavernicola TaxID=279322 RepID=A0AA48QYK2_9TREE|nr:uncharacterized protein CcaverHIS019_0608390 [Cutaneotrichosporon cavernicola]BEI94380.1 hypothetical protein CcaverHIS019_0608390 [Cutaneotrichosporon cavernicola]BEJ02157.1 hypothetical protein CcaverHIS631_0608390 [Cutaneotrichosporon cavernicola]BEJ09918.1 hypothetical protein CcaverHIS641_0608330 [Cutaneotrichosporon cavernicola]